MKARYSPTRAVVYRDDGEDQEENVMHKVVAQWNGFPGGPGISNFYFGTGSSETAADVAATQLRVKNFFSAFTLCLPTPVTVQVQQDSAVIDPVTGHMTGTLTAASAQPVVTGAGGANYSAISGACVIWKSSVFFNGRNVRGKTFLVPLTSAAYDSDGTLLAGRLSELRTAALALGVVGANPANQVLMIWHRPVASLGGFSSICSTGSVNDRVAFLKSRRA
jgi:hypothetical protein